MRSQIFHELLVYLVYICRFGQIDVLGCPPTAPQPENDSADSSPHIQIEDEACIFPPPFSSPDSQVELQWVRTSVGTPDIESYTEVCTPSINSTVPGGDGRSSRTQIRFVPVITHGRPPGDGRRNMAGAYSQVSRNHSLSREVEANHMPPYSCTRGTRYDIGRNSLPALSTRYDIHRQAGTTGNSMNARQNREIITNHLQDSNMNQALWHQICVDFPDGDLSDGCIGGLQNLISRHTTTLNNTGTPFLSADQAENLQRRVESLRGPPFNQF